MEITTCIFDLDGVIVDTAKYHFKAWRKLANKLGFDFTEIENEQLNATQKNDVYLADIKKMNSDEILEGILPLLKELKSKNINIVLGSASKNAMTILTQINILDYFDAVIDGTKTTKGKPDPQVFQMGAAAVNAEPNQCIVFEDAKKGVEAALKGGMYAVGVGSEEDLGHAHFVISGFKDYTFSDFTDKLVDVKLV